MKGKNALAVVIVILVGFILATLILRMDNSSENRAEHQAHEAPAGHGEEEAAEEPHGEVRRLAQEGFEIELGLSEAARGEGPGNVGSGQDGRIFEERGLDPSLRSEEGAPHFQAAAFENEKPVSPEAVQLTLELERPGKEPETLHFQVEEDHLRSRQAVAEPHVFAVKADAQYQGKTYRWDYWQVEGGIKLPPGAVEEAGIEVKTAGPAALKTVLATPGEIQLNPRRVAHVVPRVEGVVVEVRKELGDTIKQGEVLAVLESRELTELKSQYLVALRRLDLARATFEREERLWKEKISAEQDHLVAKKELAEAKVLEEAAAYKLLALGLSKAKLHAIASGAAASFSRYELWAPFDGEIVDKHLALGEAVKADAGVFTIADLATVWAEITVYAKDLNYIQVGQPVTVRAADTGLTGSGTVFYVGPLVGEQTRSAKAYVEIPNPERRWRPGLFVTVEVLQEEVEVPVAVVAEAVQTHQDRLVVFVQHEDLFEARPVTLGRRNGAGVEVREGLMAGERYAARNSFVLKSELGTSAATHEH
jgi:cobalt-zinc-cadmium efflux system membrane fusion protein